MAVSLPEFDSIERDVLVDSRGRAFKDFRRGLTPRFHRVWLDIAAGYVVLVVACVAVHVVHRAHPSWLVPLALGGALVIGYTIAYLQLFFHEAAHFNIARQRATNDLLANVLLGLMVGQHIKAYRMVHFDHHRFLGTTSDTERSYFDALNARFLLEGLTGFKVVRVLRGRGRHVSGSARPKARGAAGLLLGGLFLNVALLALFAVTRSWALLLAWPIGMGVVHPAINAIRQLLEHRSFTATSDVDYSAVPHGPTTRLFGSGPFASTLGGAGFNRHLFHHWDPQLSYTRFMELERYLLDTQAADTVRGLKTTYAATFVRLFKSP